MLISLPTSSKHLAVYAVVAIAIAYGIAVGPFYANNRWRRHRWSSDLCRAHGQPPELCGEVWSIPEKYGITTEKAYFDICLEHGERRRIR